MKGFRGTMLTTLFAIFSTSFLIALSGALMPGPLLTVTISESSRRGFLMGPLLVAGHAVLELALVAGLLLGLAPFLQLPSVFAATALIGSLVLFWMAFGMFRSLRSLRLSWEASQGRKRHPLLNGILMSIANPYWILWWATIGLGYILYSRQFGFWGVVFFFTGHILADLIWYSLISAAVAGGRHFLTDGIYRGLIAVCAAFLTLFAGYFAFAGFEKLTAVV
jgi:threonine/homoserine/homoserine lactone efflux protein